MRPISLSHLTVLAASPPEVIEIAAEAGYQHAGLRLTPTEPGYQQSSSGLSPAVPGETQFVTLDESMMSETLSRMASTGISILEVEAFRLRDGQSFERYRDVLEASVRLGAKHLLTTGEESDESKVTDLFAEACEVAAEYGLNVELEFVAWRGVNTLEKALRVLSKAKQPNSGILVDMLHAHRTGLTPEDLSRIDRKYIHFIHFCDAPAISPDVETMVFQSRNERLLPGDGVIPLKSYLRAMPQDVPLALEIPMVQRSKELGLRKLAKQAIEATKVILASLERTG